MSYLQESSQNLGVPWTSQSIKQRMPHNVMKGFRLEVSLIKIPLWEGTTISKQTGTLLVDVIISLQNVIGKLMF